MYIYSDEKIILASFRFLSLFIYSAFHSQEPGKKLKFREGKYLAGSVPESIIFFLFSRSPPLFLPKETILFRESRMIYIKEMLFGNKQSGNEGRRQLDRALG